MLSDRFSYGSFAASARASEASPYRGTVEPPALELVTELEQEIERRLRAATHPRREMEVVAEELRSLGHDVFSFDASDDWENFCSWGPNAKSDDYEMTLTITYSAPQSADVTFGRRRAASPS